MKRVFLALLLVATVVAAFLGVAMFLEKGRLANTGAAFIERLWVDEMNPEAYELTHPDKFLPFHDPDNLAEQVRKWKRLLGDYRGMGETRGATELAPGRSLVAVQLLFENGSAEGRFVFQERRGAHGIERFELDFEPDSELPPDPDQALPVAYNVGAALRAGYGLQAWEWMSHDLRTRIGAPQAWEKIVEAKTARLSEPQDPVPIEPFAIDKDDPSLFKGTWSTKFDNGSLWVRMTLRWVDTQWRLDDIELKRLD